MSITDGLTIDGPGDNRLTISGNDASRVFNISGSSTNVEIDDLTIAHGLANTTTALGPLGPVTLGGGILNTGAHLTLSGVTLADNQAVASQTGYVQTNLISDIPGLAQLTDPLLKDPWGTSFSDDRSLLGFGHQDQRQHAVRGDGRGRHSRVANGRHPDHRDAEIRGRPARSTMTPRPSW